MAGLSSLKMWESLATKTRICASDKFTPPLMVAWDRFSSCFKASGSYAKIIFRRFDHRLRKVEDLELCMKGGNTF